MICKKANAQHQQIWLVTEQARLQQFLLIVVSEVA